MIEIYFFRCLLIWEVNFRYSAHDPDILGSMSACGNTPSSNSLNQDHTIPYYELMAYFIIFFAIFLFLVLSLWKMYGIMACCWLCDVFLTYNNVVLLRWLFPVLDVSLNFCLCLFDVVCAESTCKWPQTQTGQFLNYPFWISSFLV